MRSGELHPDRRQVRIRPEVVTENLRSSSDGQLMVGVGRFRADALAEAYRRHAGAAFRLATRILGDRALAEEVLQEVFLRIWNQPDRYDPDRGSLRAYLLALTHGRSIDLVRSEASRRLREGREARLAAEAGYDLEHEVWDLTRAEQVRDALAHLSDDERKAIELAYFGGYTYREVATLLGQAEGTVKSRIRAGLRRLRGALVASGVEPT
jgi:RNA polymerase sigma-70 factor, ECF subfamily